MGRKLEFRCINCQMVFQASLLATPSQVACPGCGERLQLPADERKAARQLQMPSVIEPAETFRAAPPISNQRDKGSGIPKWGLPLLVFLIFVPVICCGILLLAPAILTAFNSAAMNDVLKSVPSPTVFPDLGDVERTFDSGVRSHFVEFNDPSGDPGSRMPMRVYLPPGQHQPASLPCVLVAPAGTPLLHGAKLQAGSDYHKETLPYAEAGMVVIQYSIDGWLPDNINRRDNDAYATAIGKAYPAFKAAGGGVVNGRNAIDFAMTKLAMVDPDRIATAGHSSAGTISLLLASQDSRVSRCISYAAAYDVELRLNETANDPASRSLFPGIANFLKNTSPINRTDTLNCPVFVFHARDDSNVPFADAEAYVTRLSNTNARVKFDAVARGGHYQSMVDQGIPAAIKWLKP